MTFQRGVFWGVVPYTPEAPFSVKFLRDYEDVESAAALRAEIKRRDIAGELPFSVLGKVRPVLALAEPSSILREIPALRLTNISRRVRSRQLTSEEAELVAGGSHPVCFPLSSDVVTGLTKTRESYAVIVDNPVTLHQTAVVSQRIGEVSEEDFREICKRFVAALHLDLSETPDTTT